MNDYTAISDDSFEDFIVSGKWELSRKTEK